MRQAKIQCPHCGGKITVNDTPVETKVSEANRKKIFNAAEEFFKNFKVWTKYLTLNFGNRSL